MNLPTDYATNRFPLTLTRREALRLIGLGLLAPGFPSLLTGCGSDDDDSSLTYAATIADAFEKGLTRIELEVFAANARALALYKKFGFVEEGRKRQARCLDGVLEDSLCMALLRAEAPASIFVTASSPQPQ